MDLYQPWRCITLQKVENIINIMNYYYACTKIHILYFDRVLVLSIPGGRRGAKTEIPALNSHESDYI